MTGWDELLRRLAEVPRENGTPALHETARFLADALASAGLEAELVAFTAQPYRLRLAGVLILGGVLLYFRLVRAGRAALALATALVIPALLLADLDFYVPVFGWVGAETQHHVVARLPAEEPEQRLILVAHYDTKTDVLDHVERAPVDFLAVPVIPLMLLGALALGFAPRAGSRERPLRGFASFAGWAALLYGLAAFVTLSAGAFVPKKSPGALDDGASCAVLVRLADVLRDLGPLARTEVEFALVSAEEVGVQGSWVYASSLAPPDLPTFVVNLEGLGESKRFAVLGGESFTLRGFDPAPEIVEILDSVHRSRFGEPLELTAYSGGTDARSFLAHGIPAATLIALPPDGGLFTRGLHSSDDDRSRVDEDALDESLAFLLDAVRAADGAPLAAR